MHLLIATLLSFDSMEWLTIGLVLFAGFQVFAMVHSENQRRLERKADRERSDDIAYQLAWAEQFRIDVLADEWEDEKTDLVALSCLGVLDPSDVLPRDWTAVTSALISLSVESGSLGGVALTLAHDSARRIAMLNSIVKDVLRKYPEETDLLTMASTVRQHHPEPIAELEKQIRATSRDLSSLLFDSLNQSPRAQAFRKMNFRDDMRSVYGRGVVETIKKREQEALATKNETVPSGLRGLLQGLKRRIRDEIFPPLDKLL